MSETDDVALEALDEAMQTEKESNTGRDRDREAVSNADLFSLIKTYMNKKFTGIESNIQDTTQNLSRKVRKVENSFNFKGHQIQFEFNSDIQDNLTRALDFVEKRNYDKAEALIQDSVKSLKKRNKLIRIADKSEGGWKIVQEYLSDDIASDSEDEKKIRAADTRAVKKLKTAKSDKKLNSTRKRPAEAAGSADQTATSAILPITTVPPFRGGGQLQVAQRKRSKAGDQCHNCGAFGHWARDCLKNPKIGGFNVSRAGSR